MGIKAIKSVTDNYQPNPLFEFQNMVHLNSKEKVSKYYKFEHLLGSGTYGEVYKAVNIQTGNIRAIKKINTLKFARAKALVMGEINLLKNLVHLYINKDHPSVVKIFEVFE